ncbi:zinc-ribbon domain-containing protein [Synechococcus sp. CCY9201]|uniref:zinc-ribbon domain-containing protein n=1 Tax=Synechococcus sp. CCY9201 TaxID=174697 RepID=UPI003A4C7ADD
MPQIASQAHGWDPTTVTVNSTKLLQWICDKGHIWSASVANRTPPTSSGYPVCSEHGFNPDKQAWLYILKREHEQQIGITNFMEDRLSTHGKAGWREVAIIGPRAGQKILSLERSFKQYLRINNLLVPGTHENWYTSFFHVTSI